MINKYLQDERNHILSGKIVFNNLDTVDDATLIGVDENGFLVKTNDDSGGGVVNSINGQSGDVILTAEDVDAATEAQGALADSALQPGDDIPWADITGVPNSLTAAQAAGTPSIRAIGTTATTAAAGNHTHSAATTSVNGFMSSADKTKLDGIATGANVGVVSQQEGGVGTVITNILQVTQAQFDALTPQAGTFYAIVG